MKTDVTYLYREEIVITSISVLQTVVCFHFGFCVDTFDQFNHYIFIELEEMHREVRISTQLSTKKNFITVRILCMKRNFKEAGKSKFEGY